MKRRSCPICDGRGRIHPVLWLLYVVALTITAVASAVSLGERFS